MGHKNFQKACDDAVDRATQTSSKIVKAAIDELDAYRSTVAKWDTVLAIALALTAGALIAVRRSAIERVLSASEITVLYSNITDFTRGMIGINPLIYVTIRPNTEPPRSDAKP